MEKFEHLGNGWYRFFAAILCIVIVFSNSVIAQTTSRTVEDGGTGNYKALMISEPTLPAHTVFRPGDLSVFGNEKKLQVIAWGNGACANSPQEHVNFFK